MANRMWKDGTRRGIVYVESREAAEKVMAVAKLKSAGRAAATKSASESPGTRRRAAQAPAEVFLEGAMAVYLDRRGRPFAWQIPFDITDWDRVTALVGAV